MTQTKSPLAWLGGKSRLANQIIDRIPPHTAYVEVFAGAAWVLFKKPESKVEIINDINRDLVTLYRCVKHHLPALIEQFKWLLVAREEFERFLKTPPETLTCAKREEIGAVFRDLLRTLDKGFETDEFTSAARKRKWKAGNLVMDVKHLWRGARTR